MDDCRRPQFEGKWDQIRGRVKQTWGVLTDDELDQTAGKWDRLVGLSRRRWETPPGAVERRLAEMMD